MTTLPEAMKQSELIHQLVLDRQTLETVGRIEQLWMYPKQHRVLGFVCQSHILKGRKSVFKLSQLNSLGSNGILMQGDPQDTDAGTVKQLESLLGCELWSESGDRLGKILDFQFNLNNGLIRHYLWVPSQLSRLTGDLYQLTPDEVVSVGNQRVLVSNEIARQPKPAQAGLQITLKKIKQDLKEDYSNLTQNFQTWMQEAQTLAVQTKEQAQTWVNQVSQLDWEETLENLVPTGLPKDQLPKDRFPQEQRSQDGFDDEFDFTNDIFDDWDEEPLNASSSPPPTPQTPDPNSGSSSATADSGPSQPRPADHQAAPDAAETVSDTSQPEFSASDDNWFATDETLLLAAIPEADLQDDDPWI